MVSVIDTKDEEYRKIHPERYVPALRDEDPETKEETIVFESTACLQYLAERFDKTNEWTGRTFAEKAAVASWTAYQTAGLGPTAKYWLYFLKGYPNRQNPESLPKTVAKYVHLAAMLILLLTASSGFIPTVWLSGILLMTDFPSRIKITSP